MAVTTIVSFGRRLTDNDYTLLQEQIDRNAIAGESIGEPTLTQYDGQNAIRRVWRDVDAAQGWIDFINDNFLPPPVTAFIENFE